MSLELNGKVSLVTGASRGIGRAIALRLAAAGSALYLAAEGTAAELAEVAQACTNAGVSRVSWGLHDLSAADGAEAMVQRAGGDMQRIDILVNNAGIRARKAFGDFSRGDFDRVVAVNLASPFFASQAVLPVMRARGGGHIINIASQLGLVAARYTALYGLTKAALIQLTRSMALELAADRIAVNAVCPGPILTESFAAGRHPGELEQRARDIPLGRFGTPEEVAGVVAFLLSGDAAFIAGHALVMDGGYVIH